MSLRFRTLCAVALVLVVGSMSGIAVSGWQSRQVLREELHAALVGGRRMVTGAFHTLPASEEEEAGLRRIVHVFDGDRHLTAVLLTAQGRVAERSIPLVARASPDWFAAAFRFPMAAIVIPAPAPMNDRLLLQPVFADDVGAIWSEFVELGLVLTISLLAACAMIWLTVGRALRPLADFARAFLSIGSGDYAARVRERGPLELVRLGRGVNEMTARLGSMHTRNHALEAQLATLQEEERADLARDLHDEISPHLFAVNVDAAMVRRLIEEDQRAGALAQVKAIEGSVAHMQGLVRDILSRLRPIELSDLGVGAAIGELAAFWRARHPEIAFNLRLPPDEVLPRSLRETIYRVVQEALSNAVRHGGPQTVCVSVTTPFENLLLVEISDDGAPAKPERSGGLGLIGMRERVVAVGGDLVIHRGGGGEGWRVVARLPMAVAPEVLA